VVTKKKSPPEWRLADFSDSQSNSADAGVGYDHQLIGDRMRTLFPHLDQRIPLGYPGEYPSIKGPKNTLNSAKASELLGLSCEWSHGVTGGM
jgi:hypothetical protein